MSYTQVSRTSSGRPNAKSTMRYTNISTGTQLLASHLKSYIFPYTNDRTIFKYNGVRFTLPNHADSNDLAGVLSQMRVLRYPLDPDYPTKDRSYVIMYKAVPKKHLQSIQQHGLLCNAEKDGLTMGNKPMQAVDQGLQFITPWYTAAGHYLERLDEGVILGFKLPTDEYVFGCRGYMDWYTKQNIPPEYIHVTENVVVDDIYHEKTIYRDILGGVNMKPIKKYMYGGKTKPNKPRSKKTLCH